LRFPGNVDLNLYHVELYPKKGEYENALKAGQKITLIKYENTDIAKRFERTALKESFFNDIKSLYNCTKDSGFAKQAAMLSSNLGSTYETRGNYKKSAKYYREALKYDKTENDKEAYRLQLHPPSCYHQLRNLLLRCPFTLLRTLEPLCISMAVRHLPVPVIVILVIILGGPKGTCQR